MYPFIMEAQAVQGTAPLMDSVVEVSAEVAVVGSVFGVLIPDFHTS